MPTIMQAWNKPFSRWRRKHLVWCVTALVLVAVTVSWAVHRHRRYKHFAVHEPGRVYRSAWLEPDVFAELIRKYRIRTVVNLCDAREKRGRIEDQRHAVTGAGARLVELQFPSNATWDIDYPAIHEAERLLEDPDAYPVWIHCWHGRERTVKALNIYDIKIRHMTAEESLAPMPRYGMDHPWPIVAFAYNYESHLRGTAALAKRRSEDSAKTSSTARQ